MPDIKFSNNKFYFSALNQQGKKHPILIPYIQDYKDIKGILSYLEGDVGITEKIMEPILKPILESFLSNEELKKFFADSNNIDVNDTEGIKSKLSSNYIPDNTGMKAVEKMLVSSMMESFKPFTEVMKVIIDNIVIAEDLTCRLMGTSIKLGKKNIGFPSRRPQTWQEPLGYAKTVNFQKNEITSAINKADEVIGNSLPEDSILKTPVEENDNIDYISVDQDAYYIGYFDEEGNTVEPPKWIQDSGKWFKRDISSPDGRTTTISSPFTQLNTDPDEGIQQIEDYYESLIEATERDRNKTLEVIDKRIKQASKIDDQEKRKNEINVLESEKQQSNEIFNSIKNNIRDVVYGTDKEGINKDQEGINPPISVTDWVSKTKSSQLRMRYFPQQVNTAQQLVDRKGKPKEPYVYIPESTYSYKGRDVRVQVPLAFSNQLSTEDVISKNTFYDKVNRYTEGDNIFKRYSKKTVVNNLDIYSNTDTKYPYSENSRTYFSHDINSIYIPDNIKSYYQALEWEEVYKYDLINSRTNEKVGTETQRVPFKIDVENDYELRLIQVINAPLIDSNIDSTSDRIFPEENVLLNLNKRHLWFYKYKNKYSNINIVLYPDRIEQERFINEDIFSNKYIYIRSSDEWGSENSVNGMVYNINNIEEVFTIINENTVSDTVITSDKIILPFEIEIPDYVFEYDKDNFIINSGVNSSKKIRVLSYSNNNNTEIIYSGDLDNDSISDSISFSYIEKTYASVKQEIDSQGESKKADLYVSDNPYYLSSDFNNINSIILKGLDSNSFLSVISDKSRRSSVDINKFYKATENDSDGIYNISKIEDISTGNGLKVRGIKLSRDIPSKFSDKWYSPDKNDKFYFPLDIVFVPSIKGNSNIDTGTDTLFTAGNNIPDNYKPNTNHSPDSINDMNEGRVYHGLDPRFVSDTKYKIFWLVEAVKKDNGNTIINGENMNDSTEGETDEWYGLKHKITAVPKAISLLVPNITQKIIPPAVKFIQTASNPNKISDLLVSMAVLGDKFPSIFTQYSKDKELGDVGKKKNNKPKENFDDKPNNEILYEGPNENSNRVTSLLDGCAVSEFGNGAFGKSICSYGVKMEYDNIFFTNKKDKDDKEHPLFGLILNFIKLPFEIMFKIFKWIIDWVKKLLNPAKIADAIKEFLSFDWIKEILSIKNIFLILGIKEISENIIETIKQAINGREEKMEDIIKELRSSVSDNIEVFVYDILLNGIKIRQEIVEKPLGDNIEKSEDKKEEIDISEIMESPFMSSNLFSLDDLSITGDNILDMQGGNSKFISELIKSFIGIPVAILGIEI